MSVSKIITKSNSHQIKTKTKQFNLYFIRKDMGPVPNVQFRKNSRPMESTIFVIIEKETKNLWNVQIYNKLNFYEIS